MNFSSLCKFVFALVLLSFAVPARAQQAMLQADAQINSSSPSTNYGGSTTMTISPTSSALLRYDIADLLPAGVTAAQVSRARLIVYCDKVTTQGVVDVHQVNSTWGESSVTYGTQPTIGATSVASANVYSTGAYVQINVTKLVTNWITTPASNFGMELTATGSLNFSVDAKENTGTGHQAVLQIDLIGPAGATGATGPQGPQGPAGATGAQGPAGTGAANHDATLTGAGTSASPLGVALPLTLSASLNTPVLTITNAGDERNALTATGGLNAAGAILNGGIGAEEIEGGDGLDAIGGSSSDRGGSGILAIGGTGNAGGGFGIMVYAGLDGAGTRKDAAYFNGNVTVTGNLSKPAGSFKIDHPLDPANKYLYHSFVESPDMMNVYNGNVVTDAGGTAVVTLPDWFESLNRDFRYQLTPIGQFAQAMVASEIANGQFVIRTDKGNVKVSWQVTGIRQDPWANAHRIPVEEEKPEKTRGFYLHPELYDQPSEKSVDWAERPAVMRKLANPSAPNPAR
jgi:hypothetical protein